jgi:hypothetical protein
MKTTLKKVEENYPHRTTYRDALLKLYKHIGSAKPDEEVSVLTILDAIGWDWALWNLRNVTGHDKEIRLFAVWCARQVQDYMTDKRSLTALDIAEKYALGQATRDELVSAQLEALKASRSVESESEAASSRLNVRHQLAKTAANKDGRNSAVWNAAHEASRCSALRAESYAAKAAQAAAMHVGICGSHSTEAGVAAHDAAQAAYKVAYHTATMACLNTDSSAWKASQAAEDLARLAQEKELRRICFAIDDGRQIHQ